VRAYDPSRPLIAIHVPKTGGVSFRDILARWFGRRLYRHYYDERRGRMPKKRRLTGILSRSFKPGICIYGHFNHARGFGIQDYYPEVDQFITVLREPFELVVSDYFFRRRVGGTWRDQSRVPAEDLETFVRNAQPNMLGHFPFELTLDNYRSMLEKHFIHVGITEEMNASVRTIAAKLGFAPPAEMPVRNQSVRTESVPYELRAAFREKHPLEYAVYEFAVDNHARLS
jgi:hypothetical protein